MLETLEALLIKYSLLTAFAVIGGVIWISYSVSKHLTKGRLHGSAIAISVGLLLALLGGYLTGGSKGIADIPVLAGIGLLGGAVFRDFAIVATAFGVRMEEFRSTGASGIIALLAGVTSSFVVGSLVAFAFGYRDAVSLTTVGAGAATYIVGPVTGAALEADSQLIAISVAVGLVKSILVMTVTPFVAGYIGLDNSKSALIFGGLMGTTSGVAAGLAATDAKLVPYGAMTATFYTGIGCLLGPSVFYFLIRAVVGA